MKLNLEAPGKIFAPVMRASLERPYGALEDGTVLLPTCDMWHDGFGLQMLQSYNLKLQAIAGCLHICFRRISLPFKISQLMNIYICIYTIVHTCMY